MSTTTLYHYGQILEVAPTMGLDLPKGEIRIVGILHPNNLPDHIDFRSWLNGDPESDFPTETEPWYLFEYPDILEDDTYDLPQWALEEAVGSANRPRVNKNMIINKKSNLE